MAERASVDIFVVIIVAVGVNDDDDVTTFNSNVDFQNMF